MSTEVDFLPAGLLALNLRSDLPPDVPLGTPILTLTLSVDTPNRTVAGQAEVTFKVGPGVTALVFQSHVTGTLTYHVMSSNSSMVLDLTGTPVISLPPGFGPGPVVQPNLKAIVVLDTALTQGLAHYEFKTGQADQWQRIEQKVVKVLTPVNV